MLNSVFIYSREEVTFKMQQGCEEEEAEEQTSDKEVLF